LSPPWLLVKETLKIVNKIEKGEKGGNKWTRSKRVGQSKSKIGNVSNLVWRGKKGTNKGTCEEMSYA
jgi:hypothetical protein